MNEGYCQSCLHFIQHDKKKSHHKEAGFLLWRRRWDSNPRAGVTGKLISSQPRYDRFDTSPYMFNSCSKKANLWELSLGTAKIVNIQFFKKSSYTADFEHFLKRIFPKSLPHFESVPL